jgi:hypothetical protein
MAHALQPEKPHQLLLSGCWVFKVRFISLERLVDEAGEYALAADLFRGQPLAPCAIRRRLLAAASPRLLLASA